MLFLLALLILGIVWVASALIDNDAASMESLYGMYVYDPAQLCSSSINLSIIFTIHLFLPVDLWEFYLPYLYSCISLMGGLLLLSKPKKHNPSS